ncbi:MAG: CheB methylesterase domain-containing protein [Mariprofundaceae bacterium]
MSKYKLLVLEPDSRSRLSLVNMLNKLDDTGVAGVASNPMQLAMQVKQRGPNVLLIIVANLDEPALKMVTEYVKSTALTVLALSTQLLPANPAARALMQLPTVTKLMHSSQEELLAKTPAFVEVLNRGLQKLVVQSAEKAAVGAKRPVTIPSKLTAGSLHRAVMDTLIVIGASTGGTEALKHVISKFPATTPGVLIVQHLPAAFAQSFIQKLDQCTEMKVLPALDGEPIQKGCIYVGASDQQLRIEKAGMGFICRVHGSERISGHCPSVNALFDSVALHAGSKAVGVLMTGMGDDGATGLKKMRAARALTVVQDEKSSVVWGMPGSAVKLGAAQEQVALDKLGDRVIALI